MASEGVLGARTNQKLYLTVTVLTRLLEET